MKKITLAIFIMSIVLVLAPVIGFAHGIDSVDSSTVGMDNQYEETSLYEDIINPLYIPCPYWDPSDHQWVKGKDSTVEEYVRTHDHIDGNKWVNCDIYNVVRVTDWYCACKLTRETRANIGERHKQGYN